MSDKEFDKIILNIKMLTSKLDGLLKSCNTTLINIKSILAEYQPLDINAVSLDRNE